MRLMICDEQLLFAEALGSLLAERGHELLGTPRTAQAALELAETAEPEACIVGLRLPGKAGIDALGELKAARPDIPLIALSADSDAGLLRRATEAGADGICLKADGIDDLMRVLRIAAAGGHRGLRAETEQAGTGHSKSVVSLLNGRANPSAVPVLTPREYAVLKLLIRGASTAEIASELGVGLATVRTHLQHLFHRFGVHSRLALVACVVRMQIVQPDGDAPYAGSRG